ncbi:MAG: transglutaminase domain-containing protein [Desulfobacterales bacterium]|nr:MAG: transglutaminase domain-containing protein [Desulfobacterales bacterium]
MALYNRKASWAMLCLILLFSGCTGKYFRAADQPLPQSSYLDLSNLPFNEFWTGIIFNGAKIGFSHFTISPSGAHSGRFDIRSEAAFHLRFLMFDKHINMKSYDQVASDLSLEQFSYEYDFDGNRMQLIGQVIDDTLEVEILTRGNTSNQKISLVDKIYPLSIINLYPVIHGLAIDQKYSYQVYDGETQTVSTVSQEILAYEESDLFEGAAYKMKTRLHGQEVTTWIDQFGRPVLEMSLGGIIISALENEKTAERYLTQAALNKNDVLLEFSLIKSNITIPDPERITFLEVVLSGFDRDIDIPFDERQQCEPLDAEFICQIDSQIFSENSISYNFDDPSIKRYLLPSYAIPSHNQRIRQTAAEIAEGTVGTSDQIQVLLEWIKENIEQQPVDVFTAVDVLEGKRAECQGHTYLYAAFARALGIPTKVVNGIVYSNDFQGFLYHTWAESLVDGHWIAIDPTFQQMPADATHIKLVEGENPSELLPLVKLIGKINLRIIAAEHGP